jgi:hypothetical protein
LDALAAAHDAAVQMIDTSIVRVHQHAACVARNKGQSMGRSRGGLTIKIHRKSGRFIALESPAHFQALSKGGDTISRLRSHFSRIVGPQLYTFPSVARWLAKTTLVSYVPTIDIWPDHRAVSPSLYAGARVQNPPSIDKPSFRLPHSGGVGSTDCRVLRQL